MRQYGARARTGHSRQHYRPGGLAQFDGSYRLEICFQITKKTLLQQLPRGQGLPFVTSPDLGSNLNQPGTRNFRVQLSGRIRALAMVPRFKVLEIGFPGLLSSPRQRNANTSQK
jgi:hypothetical protein